MRKVKAKKSLLPWLKKMKKKGVYHRLTTPKKYIDMAKRS